MTFIQMRSASINYAYLQSDGWRYESILKFNKHLIIIIMPITHHFFVHIYIVESLWMETETCIYEMQWFLVQEKVTQIHRLFMEIYRVIRSLTTHFGKYWSHKDWIFKQLFKFNFLCFFLFNFSCFYVVFRFHY